MSEPLVACILLTRDRPEMAKRAVECFRAQRYENKRLVVFDTGFNCFERHIEWGRREQYVLYGMPQGRITTVGEKRNLAAHFALDHDAADIFVTFDDDDVSGPDRIAEQVTLLGSGYDAVGYNEMLFWRWRQVSERDVYGPDGEPEKASDVIGEAWLKSKLNGLPGVLGTSLAYWRKVWERKPFPDLPKGPNSSGEDYIWQQGLNVHGVSSLYPLGTPFKGGKALSPADPRMIARIHAGNTSKAYDIETLLKMGNQEWTRRPDFDQLCAERMAL